MAFCKFSIDCIRGFPVPLANLEDVFVSNRFDYDDYDAVYAEESDHYKTQS